ncbi:MAG TPA: aspartate-semialdehyde dehydrogenase [Bacteroidales bacterium]|nr:aspartate-semialdehyde dehydrogenase [Bacteroidales bacterium]HSA44590.1 aspartate-semialdehyde dehydrogenase [Bacteroidales bacterium]
MKLVVAGATGLVGRMMMKVLCERNFPVSELIPVASEQSRGREIPFRNRFLRVMTAGEALDQGARLALFSAGSEASSIWAPRFAEKGTAVIDNSSAWRSFDHIPLVVPEVNANILKAGDRIIANPNCSTIPLVIVLHALHQIYGVQRVVVSTYQSVTGSGQKGIRQLEAERRGQDAERVYPHRIDLNVIPQGGYFTDNGYTSEEVKLINESRKILAMPDLKITATVVRVPVYGGHSESVNIALERPFRLEEIRDCLSATPGLTVVDDIVNQEYPMPITVEGRDEVMVGRIRRDDSLPNGLNMWIAADNLRKGAATNAVQIAESMLAGGLL